MSRNEQKRTNNLKDNLVFPNEKGNAQKCAYNFTERWKTTQNKVQKAKCFFTAKRVNIILNVKFNRNSDNSKRTIV